MDKERKIGLGSEAKYLGRCIHSRGHWGKHGKGDNGWIGYVMVAGIILMAFLFIVIFS